ncbi:hypothetical protein PROCOU_07713 [Listeria rocourtiae FSL F6-920]|nr:hypothetical protein PROCOU_07713 [Listeria rocourtiae FSL F6-920]
MGTELKKMTMTKIPLNILIFIGLTAIFPLIDFLNGLFLTTGIPVPVGVGYRFVFLLFLLISIGMEDLPKSGLTYITFLFVAGNLLIWLLQGIFLQNPISWMMADLSVFIKYFFMGFDSLLHLSTKKCSQDNPL